MKSFLRFLLAALTGVLLAGCEAAEKPAAEPPICGGVTDRTDRSAPKVIESKDITAVNASFWLYDEDSSDGKGRRWTIRMEKDDSGIVVVESADGARAEVEPSLFADVQALVERFELVKLNGTDRVTSGLAPVYSPMRLNVEYASGERLYFQTNGDPKAEWSRALLKIFNKAFGRSR